MAEVTVDGREVRVRLAGYERPFAGGRRVLAVPRGEIESVDRVDRPTAWAVTPGARAGIHVTGVLKLGRWGIGTPVHRFVSAWRHRPALRLRVSAAEAERLGYREIVVSCAAPEVHVAALSEVPAPAAVSDGRAATRPRR